MPCLRLPWWPGLEVFLRLHRGTNFLPAETRRNIAQFGVHLVPTVRPGSDTQDIEYRISFSRAEVVAIRHLSPVQHATITATKGMKNILKNNGVAPSLKSYDVQSLQHCRYFSRALQPHCRYFSRALQPPKGLSELM